MIDWVHYKCLAWGYSKSAMLTGECPGPKSLAGRIMDEGPAGAAIHTARQHDPEVLVGDALEIAVACVIAMHPVQPSRRRLTEAQYEGMFVYYCFPDMTLRDKAARLGRSSPTIIGHVNAAHRKISPFIGRRQVRDFWCDKVAERG